MRRSTLDPLILNRSLKLIEEIYDESMYGSNDIYRIKDVVHSLDRNHWESKQWLVEELYKLYKFDTGSFYIGGGWHGLLAFLLRQQWDESKLNITSGDIDPKCEKLAYKLFYDQDINFITEDIETADLSKYSAVISTSCEHIEKRVLGEFIERKNEDSWIVLQSNNFYDCPSHISCHDTIEDFIKWVRPHIKEKIYYAGVQPTFDNYFDRFMIIAK